jgi:hypothetical protein
MSRASKELIFACSLANPKIRASIGTYCRDIEWSSDLAKKVVSYFLLPDVSQSDFNPIQFKAFAVNFAIEGEVDSMLDDCLEYCNLKNNVKVFLESFQKFYRYRYVTDLVHEAGGDVDTLITGIERMRDVNLSPIPVDRLGELDLDQVIQEDLGSDDPIPTSFEFLQKALDSKGYLRGQVAMVVAPPSSGKSQPVDALIFTPAGVKKMGDISVGDEVCIPAGGIAKVTHIHPQGVIEVYKVAFSDGTSTECSLDHLWLTSTKNERDARKSSVKSLREIQKTLHIENGTRINHTIPQAQPLHFSQQENLPIDAYILGVLLGDGGFTTTTPSFSSGDPELIEILSSRLPHNVHLVKSKGQKYGYYLSGGIKKKKNPVTSALRELGVYGCLSLEKFIPSSYLFASPEDRVELLRGLMDTDGTSASTPYFGTSSYQLACDVKFLVESLGGIAVIRSREKTRSFRVFIRLLSVNPFRLSRKASKWTHKTRLHRRSIVSIDFIGCKECRCITLDDKLGLYITNNGIVTHNSLFLANECVHFLKNGLKVYWVALGDMMRFDFISRLTSIVEGRRLSTLEKPELREAFGRHRELFKNLRMSVLPAGQVDAYTIKSFLETSISTEEDVDVFMLDYDANLLARSESSYIEGDIVYNTMSAISRPQGRKYRLVLIASQPKIQYWEDQELDKNSAADSSRKQAIVDIMITIGRNNDSEDHRGTLKAAKVRRGREGIRAFYIVEECGRFKEEETPGIFDHVFGAPKSKSGYRSRPGSRNGLR